MFKTITLKLQIRPQLVMESGCLGLEWLLGKMGLVISLEVKSRWRQFAVARPSVELSEFGLVSRVF